MSTIAYRASLVRTIEQAMKRVDCAEKFPHDVRYQNFLQGKLDAYAHILSLIDDMEDQ